ncbi:Fructose-bisphosphate aldolase [Gracilariopsis chorda]|uniref:fructose-bisphosphate aldolase n=1 Tax=Gracilariopsis chorda TaxID=448386 RepID=A0A2V3IVL9_9FLOR|nr:Fructose-bisphosphate aldolase [Gracilariopsis chorda]|eukprot:PXF46188.1 Fructose-bisphosphate aldolase [Gracilariopsis chorda]
MAPCFAPSVALTALTPHASPLSASSFVPSNVPALQPRSQRCSLRMTFEAGLFETENPYAAQLKQTAQYIASRGSGILASDESNSTTGKRLATIGLENTEQNRRRWRQLLYTADIGDYISGAIMFEETLYQSAEDGTPFVDILRAKGIVPGIKVDTGLTALPRTKGETATTGLDGLPERCKKYYQQGARFAKWRAVMRIGKADGAPSDAAILENAHALARYAHISQANGLVPIVEPEVLLDGDHPIEETAYYTERVLSFTFRALNEYDVCLDAALLKPNMVNPGTDSTQQVDAQTVAKYTLQTMMRGVPPAMPGIHFLSGGMSDQEATENLNLLNSIPGSENAPWSLNFSYGRALQMAVLRTWAGDDANKDKAQQLLAALAKANGEAQLGKYTGPHPSPGGKTRNFQPLRLV